MLHHYNYTTMSDLGRKNVSDKVSEAIKPDTEKTTLEKAKETITNKADELGAKGTPEDQKSFGQTVSDNIQQGHSDAKKAVSGEGQTLTETVNSYVEAGKEQLENAAQYVSGVVTGATEGAKTAASDAKK